jgi:hypothetical protein
MLRNLTDLVKMGESGFERADFLRSELQKCGTNADIIREAVRKGAKTHLLLLQKYTSWEDTSSADAVEVLLKRIPEISSEEINQQINIGKKISKVLKDYENTCRNEENENRILELRKSILQKYPFLKSKLEKMACFFKNKRRIVERNRGLRLNGETLSSVQSKVDHSIGSLKPCEVWNLLIDESGKYYEEDASGKHAGRIVGVLTPSSTTLPELFDFHAASESPERVDQVLQNLLDSPVGIFGISVRDIPLSKGERWMDGVCEVIHWVWQQLPIDPVSPNPSLNVFIENRGEFDVKADLRALRRELLRQWAVIDPRRGVTLSLKVIGKKNNGHLGYADAVAFTWGSPAQESKARLRQSGLLGTCLQDIGSGTKLRNLRDFFARPELMDGEYWKWLISLEDSMNPHSLSGQVLDRLAAHCRANSRKWDELVESLFQYLESKALDLFILGRQCEWLEYSRPLNCQLPKTVALMLRVAQLATKNHRGATGCEPLMDEVRQLGTQLLMEDARLVCRADLHLAVQPTNSFQFDLAGRHMLRWRDMLGMVIDEHAVRQTNPDMGVMTIGLKLSGRVKSTLGQHLAFQGRNAQACELFQLAIKDFERLSDKKVATKDMVQTGTYLAIASMDDPNCPPEVVLQRVEQVLGPLDQAVKKLARDVDPSRKYSHHLLLRYLAQFGDNDLVARYMDAAKDMPYEYGHPWQLIQFYRVCMARRIGRSVSQETIMSIWDLAFDAQQGQTVRFIGMAIGAALGSIDPSWEIVPKTLLVLSENLPAAKDRLELLEHHVKSPPVDSLVALRELLPFNFR